MQHILPTLPFAKDALMPTFSAETFDYHHGKHHKAYVDKLNNMIVGTEFEKMELEEIVKSSSDGIFNNAAQHWNHSFFWNCLSASKTTPQGPLANAINDTFGSLDVFNDKFVESAVGVFGSGWTWLIKNSDGSIAIETTANGETPIKNSKHPLLTIDVWEHAYYIDYRNDRAKYLNTLKSVLNWDFAGKCWENSFKVSN
ncbi:MAG: superoxide dismutase [Bdellovibrionaceae bacterium]|nr:superoxide dismutase [Fe] [Pseudobdellovibrionaceae bacterium]MCB9026366.1 superoxide dismutase [Pseudobdellovibrionaceae bacterium]|tara:strand:- start:5980 stop:6576 length:597 start_codon:yes stop_codon:yes gene_type:complete